jgi:hypothetical protein
MTLSRFLADSEICVACGRIYPRFRTERLPTLLLPAGSPSDSREEPSDIDGPDAEDTEDESESVVLSRAGHGSGDGDGREAGDNAGLNRVLESSGACRVGVVDVVMVGVAIDIECISNVCSLGALRIEVDKSTS